MMTPMRFVVAFFASLIACLGTSCSSHAAEPNIDRWLVPQDWRRDVDGPVVSLGQGGAFDDMHLFAPCVALERGRYLLWYSGSRDAVAERVFRLGLATSEDGRLFEKSPHNPVLEFPGGKQSILTPAILRSADGQVLREEGQLKLWFSSTDFTAKASPHTLHVVTSEDGVAWSKPSPALLNDVYAPTILKEDGVYWMWYTDVAREPWILRHARSDDGLAWTVTEAPALTVDQTWEHERLFYPAVIKQDGLYLMWYGSYWQGHPNQTALGFAVSRDGVSWRKHPGNPVFTPDPTRAWE
jgi:predicted GH43/DUF377 family glycosyl hydrolase